MTTSNHLTYKAHKCNYSEIYMSTTFELRGPKGTIDFNAVSGELIVKESSHDSFPKHVWDNVESDNRSNIYAKFLLSISPSENETLTESQTKDISQYKGLMP
jgi:hypothetical protein